MLKTPDDLNHLTVAAQKSAKLSKDTRIKRIHADTWIGYTRAQTTLTRLEQLFDWPAKQRMPNLLITGLTNNGKSMIIEKFRRQHPSNKPENDIHSCEAVVPVAVLQMPSEPSVSRFYSMLIRSLGRNTLGRNRVSELEQLALIRLHEVKTRVLVIDELHNVLAGQSDKRREFLNLLRFIGNELCIPIVGVGTRDAYLAIRSDDQLENRFEPLLLPRWQPNDELISLLASFAASFPLHRPSLIATEDMAHYIMNRTEGTIGEIAHFLRLAAIAAIESGEECINSKTLSLAHYSSPLERRRNFERTLL